MQDRTFGYQCIHHIFERQAQKRSDAVALVFKDEQLTYGELNRQANRLAHLLQEAGVGPDSVVAILLDRSFDLIISILAILKAGGAYLPLNPLFPRPHISFLLADAEACAVITCDHLKHLIDDLPVRMTVLNQGRSRVESQADGDPHSEVTPEHLAYICFTSGSTGRPKGTEVPHRAIPGFMSNVSYAKFDENQVSLQHSSICWDGLTLELWPPLLHGGRCVLYSGEPGDLDELTSSIRQHRVNSLWLTSSLFNAVIEAHWESLNAVAQLMVGGEALSVEHVRKARELLKETKLINGYGPSECTVFSCCEEITGEVGNGKRSIEIGRAIGDRRVYVLDKHMNRVPIGVVGELYVGGPGVGRGYKAKAEMTAEKFIPNPYKEEFGGRMYRTGDFVKYVKGGKLEYVGRGDNQVKVQGHRVELEEIERVIELHEGVKKAVAVVAGEGSEKKIVGYIVRREGCRISKGELREWMKMLVPQYMVPSIFVELAVLPLTPNGKIDWKILPIPELGPSDQAYARPRTTVEEILAGIFSQALKLERVGIEDNFFDLGGHSLLATHVVSRVKAAFMVELPLRALFESPTVASLARPVEKAMRQGQSLNMPALCRTDWSQSLPLSFAQQRLWFINQLEPESTLYHLPKALRLEGELDVAALERSLQEIIRRHKVLRTNFRLEPEGPVQVINEDWKVALPVKDLSHLTMDERLEEARRLAEEESERPFDLSYGPLLRYELLRLAEQDYVFLVNMHHIVSDEWSEGILIRELTALYEAYGRGESAPLAEFEVQYADFAVWQRKLFTGPFLDQQLNYWRNQLSNFQELRLPTDWPRPEMQTHRGDRLHFMLSAELSESIKRLSRATNSTLYMVLLAAFKALLHRYTGQDYIVVGSPIANRTRAEAEELIGFFVNTIVLCSDLSGNPTFKELIDRVREITLDAYTHQDLPFDLLVEDLRPARKTNYSPLVRVIFEIRDVAGKRDLQLPLLSCTDFHSRRHPAYFDLTLSMNELPGGIGGYFEYSTDLFTADTIEEMKQRLESLLEAVTNDSNLRLLDIPLDSGEPLEDEEALAVLKRGDKHQTQFTFD